MQVRLLPYYGTEHAMPFAESTITRRITCDTSSTQCLSQLPQAVSQATWAKFLYLMIPSHDQSSCKETKKYTLSVGIYRKYKAVYRKYSSLFDVYYTSCIFPSTSWKSDQPISSAIYCNDIMRPDPSMSSWLLRKRIVEHTEESVTQNVTMWLN